MIEMTKQQLAEKLGVEYIMASGLISYLEYKGLVKKIGKIPAKGGKGKPSDVFSIPDKVEINLAA